MSKSYPNILSRVEPVWRYKYLRFYRIGLMLLQTFLRIHLSSYYYYLCC
nr:MAG TPA: hypothetical protein [Caudoviricetes sp.]